MSTQEASPRVGFVGLGHMGTVMSRHLLGSGRPVVGWDRRPEALEAFTALGGTAVAKVSDLGAAPVVISIVFDDAGTREVSLAPGGLVDTMAPGAVHIVMASISASLTRELAEAHAARGQHFLAASIFGRPEAAEEAALLINCSGSPSAYEIAKPILSTMGRVRWVGSEPEQAMLIKTIGNSMIHTTVELLREMFEFLRAGGVGPTRAKELIVDSLFPGPIYTSYAQRYIEDPSSAKMIDMARKDRRNCLEAAERLSIDLPIIRFLGEHDLP